MLRVKTGVFLVLWTALAMYASPLERARLQRLYGAFVAPCCWRESVLIHQSDAADEVKQEIASMVNAGRSDDAIRQALIAKYGRQILIVPEGTAAGWLNTLPWVFGVAGCGVVILAIRRSLRLGAEDEEESRALTS